MTNDPPVTLPLRPSARILVSSRTPPPWWHPRRTSTQADPVLDRWTNTPGQAAYNCARRRPLLVAQRFDRIETRGFDGGIGAEEDPDAHRDHEADDRRPERDAGR